jgi:hypothetical protein
MTIRMTSTVMIPRITFRLYFISSLGRLRVEQVELAVDHPPATDYRVGKWDRPPAPPSRHCKSPKII